MYYNFFLIRHYSLIFYFINAGYNSNFLKNTSLDNKFLNVNNYTINNTNKVRIYTNSKYTNVKIINYFNTYFSVTKKYKIGQISEFNGYYFLKLNKSFINFFFNLSFSKKNFLILDNDYSHIFPLYKFIFGVYALNLYKSFFLMKPVYFTHKS
jgi:hypothetical protein